MSHRITEAAAIKANDPLAMSFGRRTTAYAVILATTASIVLPLWPWYVGPLLQRPGRRGDRGPGLMIVPWVLAIGLTSAIARLLGISLAGTSVEVRRKVGGEASPGGPEPLVEVNYPGFLHGPPIAVLPFILFVASILFIIVPPPPSGLANGAAGAVAFGVLTLSCLNLFRNPALRLDGGGILGYPSGGLGFHRRFVPRPEVATYTIETSRDDFGQATRTALSFDDSRGVTPLRIRPRRPGGTAGGSSEGCSPLGAGCVTSTIRVGAGSLHRRIPSGDPGGPGLISSQCSRSGSRRTPPSRYLPGDSG